MDLSDELLRILEEFLDLGGHAAVERDRLLRPPALPALAVYTPSPTRRREGRARARRKEKRKGRRKGRRRGGDPGSRRGRGCGSRQ